MERQNRLVKKILSVLASKGILDGVLLIGSWCAYFYKSYFSSPEYNPRIRTRDIDFLLPTRPRFKNDVDLEQLMAPLGFEVEFFGKGYMKLESEELSLEFLIPEVGPHKERPVTLTELKFNAQPLRHMAMLWRNPISVRIEGIKMKLPHPADFFIQKLIVASKRRAALKGKRDKDRETAFEVLDALLKSGAIDELRAAMSETTTSERRIVMDQLKVAGRMIDI